ncbi:sensor histidine kinase [Streptomyces chattanoogensis]|uniref:sensor histidine kinase n=1 Tax=Streptomyces chattanoogensis TaxID=66876 RepID=UPI0036C00FC1
MIVRGLMRRLARLTTSLGIGACTAVVELPFTLLSALVLLIVLPWPRGRRAVLTPLTAVAGRLAEVERRRLARFGEAEVSHAYARVRALQYVAVRWMMGVVGMVVVFGPLSATVLWAVLVWPFTDLHHPGDVAATGVGNLFFLLVGMQGVFGVAHLEGLLARHFLGPRPEEVLERRIEQLAASRAGVVAAVNDERRRIERDLHDGVQQRLVALGMLLGRALRSRDEMRADQLLRQAHEESRQALTELREVAWRIYPTALDEAGLRAALETVAERSSVPVQLDYRLDREPGTALATVAYFVVCEAVTNAVKHADAGLISVRVAPGGDGVLVCIEDDGPGGADSSGSGLFGLARRVAALDGRFRVESPPGGPTTITAELPCA